MNLRPVNAAGLAGCRACAAPAWPARGALGICAISSHRRMNPSGRWFSGALRIWSVLLGLSGLLSRLSSLLTRSPNTKKPTPAKSRFLERSKSFAECLRRALSILRGCCQLSNGIGWGGVSTSLCHTGRRGRAIGGSLTSKNSRSRCGSTEIPTAEFGGSNFRKVSVLNGVMECSMRVRIQEFRTGTFSRLSAIGTRLNGWMLCVVGGSKLRSVMTTKKHVTLVTAMVGRVGISRCTQGSVTKPRLIRLADGGAIYTGIYYSWRNAFCPLGRRWSVNASGGLGSIDAARAVRLEMLADSHGFSARFGSTKSANGYQVDATMSNKAGSVGSSRFSR